MSNCQESHVNEYSFSIIVVAKRAVVSLSYLALLSQGVQGQVLPPPIFTTTSPVEDSVVMENIYNFREMTYSPFVPLAPVANSDESSHDLPENAVISHISAAINQDYNWWLGTWDPDDSQELIREFDDTRPESPEAYWTNRWEAGYLNKQVFFISRIETGEYVLIGLQVLDEEQLRTGDVKPDADAAELPIVLKKFGDRWLVTQELQTDPILYYWSTLKTTKVFQNVVRQ